jgi:hypothetical protein
MTDVLEGPRSFVLVYSVESHRRSSVFVIWSTKFFLFLLMYRQLFKKEVSAVLSPFLLIASKVPVVTSRNIITLQGSEILN